MTDEYTKLKVELFVGCVTWIRKKKTRENLEKQLRVVSLKGNIYKALTCFALLHVCSSLEFTIINIYQIKMFIYHS